MTYQHFLLQVISCSGYRVSRLRVGEIARGQAVAARRVTGGIGHTRQRYGQEKLDDDMFNSPQEFIFA